MPSLKYWDGTQYVPILGGIGQGAADARYVKQAGDTMTGALTMLAEDGTARSLVMAPASNGATGIRLIQASGVTAGDLAPLGVLDPALPEHAATRQFVETYAGEKGIIAPASGFSDHTYGLFATKTMGALVTLTGQFRVTTTWTSDGYSRLMGTIPAGFRPAITAFVAAGVLVIGSPMAAVHPVVVVPQANGDLRIVLASGIAVTAGASNYVGVNVTYRLSA